MRTKLPITRKGETTKIEVYTPTGQLDVYITVNCYEGTNIPGEVFVNVGLEEHSWLSQWARAVSVLLQHGETVTKLVDLFGFTRFEPAGRTSYQIDGKPLLCTSLVDLVVRYMDSFYSSPTEEERTIQKPKQGVCHGG